jgi:hypothetical protein
MRPQEVDNGQPRTRSATDQCETNFGGADFFFFFLYLRGCSSYGVWPRMTRITIYTGFWIHFPLGGRDSRFDRIIKVHNALKTFLDL